MQAEHIFVRRKVYTHHGLYIGNDRVIHFTGEPLSKTDATVNETTIESFSDGDELYRIIYKKRLPVAESIQRARGSIGASGYNLISNNCEHFATWCMTGKLKSKQLESVKSTILGQILINGALYSLPVGGQLLFSYRILRSVFLIKNVATVAKISGTGK